MERFKLMILSDNVATTTGLARITRELTLRIHQHLGDAIEVCTYGPGKQHAALPWNQYEMILDNLIPTNLPATWQDFAGDERGAILVIWNVSHVPYFSFPEKCPDEGLRKFVQSKLCDFWTYTPIDGDCRPGVLPLNMAEALHGFDRVAHYTNFAKRITDAAWDELGLKDDTTVLPHGLDTKVFYPRNREEARKTFYQRATGEGENPIKDDVVLLGCVGTNSPRKDWGNTFETCAALVKRGVNIGLWAHVDHARRSWDLIGLAREFGMQGRLILSRPLSDEEMAWMYSACDCVIANGSGGGWELPITEALGCGVPVVHNNYAGGAELLPPKYLVEPMGYRLDGFFSVRRPVQSPFAWADAIQRVLGICPPLPPYVPWDVAWETLWKPWLLKGIA